MSELADVGGAPPDGEGLDRKFDRTPAAEGEAALWGPGDKLTDGVQATTFDSR